MVGISIDDTLTDAKRWHTDASAEVNESRRLLDFNKLSPEELDPSHPFWNLALYAIDALAPTTRRDDWWGTDGPKTVIFRALLAAAKGEK